MEKGWSEDSPEFASLERCGRIVGLCKEVHIDELELFDDREAQSILIGWGREGRQEAKDAAEDHEREGQGWEFPAEHRGPLVT